MKIMSGSNLWKGRCHGYMVTVKLVYENEKEILVRGLFLEGSRNKIYKNASIDNRIFLYLYKDGTISCKTKKIIKLYERGCKSIRETQNDKIHLLIYNYIIECELNYYSWNNVEFYVDDDDRYSSMAEYKITSIFLCDDSAFQTINNYVLKGCALGVLRHHIGMREEKIGKIIETCQKVNNIEKERFINIL